LTQNAQNLLELNRNKTNLEHDLIEKNKRIKEMEIENFDIKKQLNELKISSDFNLSAVKKEVR
jgi:hypothetical protein